MAQRVLALVLVAAGVAAAPAGAQQLGQPAGSTPAECVQQANQWRTRQVTEARAAQRPVNGAALLAEARRLAAECGAKFTIETTPSAQLTALAGLYSYAGDTARVRLTIARALQAPDLGPRQHGDVVLLALAQALATGDAFAGINAAAEAFVAELDALPDSLLDLKIRAHQTALGRYGYADIDDGIRLHALALLALGRQAGAGGPGRGPMVQAYADLARAAADFLLPDSALRVLANAERELAVPLDSIPALADARGRYALVGTPAAAITGELWLNPDGAAATVPVADGKVRLIQFTAHWCAPCRNSYPGMRRVAQRFAGQPVEVLFVTELYGSFEGRPATEAEELAADRVYYAQQQIPFRIAVNRLPQAAPGTPGPRIPPLNQQYRVGGIPQIMVVDQHGVIRQVVVGWDRGNEQRLGSFIESLLRGRAG
ncbi:MAG: TlpA family protein disulfide reductase [Gemmatimonadetes bacterium]|nr:TlpA family protein disulfide reductase [Gemmatimonadota bacterium]